MPRVTISIVTGSPLSPMAGSIGNWLTSVLGSLHAASRCDPGVAGNIPGHKTAPPDQRNIEIRCALNMIADENTQTAGIDGEGLVQAEFRGEIRHRTRP